MGRGYSVFTRKRHRNVREMYNQRVSELGDMAKFTSKEYFVEYIYQALKEKGEDYSRASIIKILNNKCGSQPDFE